MRACRRSACSRRSSSRGPSSLRSTAPFLLAARRRARARRRRRGCECRVELDRERALEGDESTRTRRAHGVERRRPPGRLLALPTGVELERRREPGRAAARAGRAARARVGARAAAGARYVLGDALSRAHDPLGPARLRSTSRRCARLKVYPRPRRPATRAAAARDAGLLRQPGRARRKGEGIEFADIRPFAPGDRVRRVNWRASGAARRAVGERGHPERNTDVILFLDSFAEARRDGRSTLDLAVRAAAALADAYLQRRDRVGLSASAASSLAVPGDGLVQLYRIVDALLDTRDRPQLRLEGYRRDPAPHAAAEGARDRAVAAARRARGRRAARPARPRLRPRGRRRLARAVHAAAAGGLDALAHDSGRYGETRSATATARGSAGRRVARRHAAAAALEEVRAFRRYARHAHV